MIPRQLPILFSTEMIKSIIAGRKTKTRRIIKESFNGCLTNGGPHPCPNDPVVVYPGEKFEFNGEIIKCDFKEVRAFFHCSTLDSIAKCRTGKPGDILWVRETFALPIFFDGGEHDVYYKADDERPLDIKHRGAWKPSIHMRKLHARIWLQVKDISVQSLRDITESDAIAEGVEKIIDYGSTGYKLYTNPNATYSDVDAIWSFESLWESINGKESWQQNPWVWVTDFEVLSVNGRPDKKISLL